jgi:uncharacterized alpha-E superfamily protein
MLCRTASDLFWMGRAVERAEAMARLLDLARRLAALPGSHGAQAGHTVWALPLLSTGSIPPGAAEKEWTTAEILTRCVLDHDNHNSVMACVQLARDAARNQRSVVPAEVVAPLQLMLSKMRNLKPQHLVSGGLGQVIGEIMAFSDMFRGVTFATMMRNEAWHFLRLAPTAPCGCGRRRQTPCSRWCATDPTARTQPFIAWPCSKPHLPSCRCAGCMANPTARA